MSISVSLHECRFDRVVVVTAVVGFLPVNRLLFVYCVGAYCCSVLREEGNGRQREPDCICTLKLPVITQADKVSPSMQRENKIKMTALEIYSCKIKLRHKNMVLLVFMLQRWQMQCPYHQKQLDNYLHNLMCIYAVQCDVITVSQDKCMLNIKLYGTVIQTNEIWMGRPTQHDPTK